MCLAELDTFAKFHKNLSHTRGRIAPQTIFTTEEMNPSACKKELASFGSHFPMCLRWILTKLRTFGKFGLVNRSIFRDVVENKVKIINLLTLNFAHLHNTL